MFNEIGHFDYRFTLNFRFQIPNSRLDINLFSAPVHFWICALPCLRLPWVESKSVTDSPRQTFYKFGDLSTTGYTGFHRVNASNQGFNSTPHKCVV
jgi:hypothetical protein